MPEKFYVAAKGWVKKGTKTLVLKDENEEWDLPGGRIDCPEFGAVYLRDVLERELREEIQLGSVYSTLRGISQWSRRPRGNEKEINIVRIFVVHFDVIAPDDFEPVLSTEHKEYCWSETPKKLIGPGLIPENEQNSFEN